MRLLDARLAALVLSFAQAFWLAQTSGCYRTNVRREPDAAPVVPDAAVVRTDAFVPEGPDAFLPRDGCARDRDCESAICIQDFTRDEPADLEPVPLRCGAPVGTLPPNAECTDDAECDHGLCALAGGCIQPCLDPSDCGAGERCTRVPIVTSAASLQFAQGCVRWVDPPAGVTVLANESITVSRFSTEELALEAMAAPTRLVLYVAAGVDDNRYVTGLQTSRGESLYDLGLLGVSRQSATVIANQDLVPVLLPGGSAEAPRDTGFVLTLETSRTSELRRIVMDRPAPGTTLDYNFFYVGVDGPRAGSPPREVREMLEQLGTLLETIGLRLGRDRHFEVVGASARTFSVIEDDAEVGELFTFSAGAARPAINVFLIRSGADFLGIAGGAPGAQVVHGTHASGIAIGFEDLQSILRMAPPDLAGTVIGHETGHFLGFFHTTEQDGTVVEPLEDTPECPIARDLDGDGILLPEECAGLGAENVMFWAPFVPGPRFTARQQRILENAMVLQ